MIKEFQGEYRWLSNFAPCTITLGNMKYMSVEHAYMSAKSDDPKWKKFCAETWSPGVVKKASRGIQLIPNWDVVKIDIMQKCLLQKYSQEPYRSKLLATGDSIIQEGNYWGDKFWGVCLKTGAGKNVLGNLIMNIRSTIIKE